MSEKEIRRLLQTVCVELDQRAKAILKQGVHKVVLPTVLGAGLALSSGCDLPDSVYGSPIPIADVGPTSEMGMGMLYMAPDWLSGPKDAGVEKDGIAEAGIAQDASLDAIIAPPYSAPDVGTDSGSDDK